jgi:hypothetical protein
MKVLVVWDEADDPKGNVSHIARHQVTPIEVEQVLNDPRSSASVSRSSGLPMTIGRTREGRHLIVIFRVVLAKPYTVQPVTAYTPTKRPTP